MILCPVCGTTFSTAKCPKCLPNEPSSEGDKSGANPYAADPIPAQARVATPTPQQEGDGTGGIIPYKNPKALLAYYLGIASGIPFIGLPFGIAAFVLGIQGLRARKQNPVIKGSVHAGIGIGCGLLFTILWSLLLVGMVVGIAFQ